MAGGLAGEVHGQARFGAAAGLVQGFVDHPSGLGSLGHGEFAEPGSADDLGLAGSDDAVGDRAGEDHIRMCRR